MTLAEPSPGIIYVDCRQEPPIGQVARCLDLSDNARRLQSRLPGIAVLECSADADRWHYTARLLERIAGTSGVLGARPWLAGLLYGPVRSAAWRVLDAKHFGSAERCRATYVVVSSSVDPAFLFEQSGG
jgi:hypothetical protein